MNIVDMIIVDKTTKLLEELDSILKRISGE